MLRYFTKEDNQIGCLAHSCSIELVINKMQIKTIIDTTTHPLEF